MPIPSRSGLLLALLLLPVGQALAAKAPAPVQALYDQMDEASDAYRAGYDQTQRGEPKSGREAMRQASARLLEAARRCQATRRCESARFIAAYDALIVLGAAEPGQGGASAIPEAARTEALLKGRDLRELIAMNQPVQAAMAEWLTWMRPSLITSWENYQQMRFLMWPEYERAGLPEALLFGILAKESNGRVHAVSSAGAAGPMQFMPATGARFGLGWRDGFDTRYDPQLAARASVLYFNERFAELNDELEFAVAAYNGGEGRALRIKNAAGGRDFWDPAVYGQFPPETRDYVPYVLAAAWLFLHPEEAGLEFPKVDGAATVMKLKAPASIYQLAICLGGPREGFFRALRNLNARYEADQTLPAGTELRVPVAVPPIYDEHCVSGPRAQLAVQLMDAHVPTVAAAPAPRPAQGRVYRVKAGDTLSSISRRHGCQGPDQLARANRLRSPYVIRTGQRLKLVGCTR
jgi:membrane-bound lytic murein transglycosylase D